MTNHRKLIFGILAALAAFPLVLFYVAFVCGVPVAWPYYRPELDGAEVLDRTAWYLPRAGRAPIARVSLEEGAFVDIAKSCYPMRSEGYGQCMLTMRFAAPADAVISFADVPVEIQSPEGEDFVDYVHYTAFAEHYASVDGGHELRDGRLHLGYSDFLRTASVILAPHAGPVVMARLPDILIDGRSVSVPPIRFTRVDDRTCHGLFANF